MSDEAIRALVRSVAQATVELVWEKGMDLSSLAAIYRDRHEIADEMVDAVMECADEDPDSEVHALRGDPTTHRRTDDD